LRNKRWPEFPPLLLFLWAVEREFQRRLHLPLVVARAGNGCKAARIARLYWLNPVTLLGWPNCGVLVALKASQAELETCALVDMEIRRGIDLCRT
jgi:hypothetical protein